MFGSFYEKSFFFFFWLLQHLSKEHLKRQTKTFLSFEFRTTHTVVKYILLLMYKVNTLSSCNIQPWGPAVCNPRPTLVQHICVTLAVSLRKLLLRCEKGHELKSCKIRKAKSPEKNVMVEMVIARSSRIQEEKYWQEKLKLLEGKKKKRRKVRIRKCCLIGKQPTPGSDGDQPFLTILMTAQPEKTGQVAQQWWWAC